MCGWDENNGLLGSKIGKRQSRTNGPIRRHTDRMRASLPLLSVVGGSAYPRFFTRAGVSHLSTAIKNFRPGIFFEEHYFWNNANVGPLIIGILTAPLWYSGLKTMYWTFRYRKLDQQEIISDRFIWLHERMLEDEIENLLLEKVPEGGFPKDKPGNLLGPSKLS